MRSAASPGQSSPFVPLPGVTVPPASLLVAGLSCRAVVWQSSPLSGCGRGWFQVFAPAWHSCWVGSPRPEPCSVLGTEVSNTKIPMPESFLSVGLTDLKPESTSGVMPWLPLAEGFGWATCCIFWLLEQLSLGCSPRRNLELVGTWISWMGSTLLAPGRCHNITSSALCGWCLNLLLLLLGCDLSTGTCPEHSDTLAVTAFLQDLVFLVCVVLGFLTMSHWDVWTVDFSNELTCSQTYLKQKICLI